MDKYIETVGEIDKNFGLKVIETKYYTAVMRFRRLVYQKVGTGTDRNRIHMLAYVDLVIRLGLMIIYSAHELLEQTNIRQRDDR